MKPMVGVVIGLVGVGIASALPGSLALVVAVVGWLVIAWQCQRLGRGVSRWFGATLSVCALGAAVSMLTAAFTWRISAMLLIVVTVLVLNGARDAIGPEHGWFRWLGRLRWLLLVMGVLGLLVADVVPRAETALSLVALPMTVLTAIGIVVLLLGLRDHPALQARPSDAATETGGDVA